MSDDAQCNFSDLRSTSTGNVAQILLGLRVDNPFAIIWRLSLCYQMICYSLGSYFFTPIYASRKLFNRRE